MKKRDLMKSPKYGIFFDIEERGINFLLFVGIA